MQRNRKRENIIRGGFMFISKEEAKLLSDDDFERVGRRKKLVVFIFILLVVSVTAISAFMLLNRPSDKNINVEQAEVNILPEKETVDETVVSESEMELKEAARNEMSETGNELALPVGRKTELGENEFICEYSDILLPELLKVGDYADVRLSLADGRNYTVVSEKKIMDFNKSKENSLVYLALCEEEIIILESALSDIKLFEGAKLYLTIGKQSDRHKVNYPVNKRAAKLLSPKKITNNLSGYTYDMHIDKSLESERERRERTLAGKDEEWKEAAAYWNKKE